MIFKINEDNLIGKWKYDSDKIYSDININIIGYSEQIVFNLLNLGVYPKQFFPNRRIEIKQFVDVYFR